MPDSGRRTEFTGPYGTAITWPLAMAPMGGNRLPVAPDRADGPSLWTQYLMPSCDYGTSTASRHRSVSSPAPPTNSSSWR